MCYKGKCLYCIPIKPACLVLAIINAILNGLVVMWYLFTFGFAFLVFRNSGGPSLKIGGIRFKRDVPNDKDVWKDMIVIWCCFVVPIIALLNVIFSGLLCNGICKNRPKQVKAYLWYGVAVTVLTWIAAVVLIYVDTDNRYSMYAETSWTTGFTWILGCVLHTLFLIMVHQTHKKVVEDTMFCGHVLDDRELSVEKHQV